MEGHLLNKTIVSNKAIHKISIRYHSGHKMHIYVVVNVCFFFVRGIQVLNISTPQGFSTLWALVFWL